MGIGGADSGRGVSAALRAPRLGAGFADARGVLRDAGNAALAVVLAPACASCAAVLASPLSGPICDVCWAAVPPMTAPWRTRAGIPVHAAAPYDGTLRNIIHAWKFEGRQRLVRPLADLVRARCPEALADGAIAVPVPMTPWRQWRRGFNQADDLAGALGARRVRALARWRPRPAQSTLPRARRALNLDASVMVQPWRREAIRGRAVLLVDDVVTTGATLDACARLLRSAGAADVRAIVVARTMPRG